MCHYVSLLIYHFLEFLIALFTKTLAMNSENGIPFSSAVSFSWWVMYSIFSRHRSGPHLFILFSRSLQDLQFVFPGIGNQEIRFFSSVPVLLDGVVTPKDINPEQQSGTGFSAVYPFWYLKQLPNPASSAISLGSLPCDHLRLLKIVSGPQSSGCSSVHNAK